MKKKKILPVILSGGFGARLWPLSKKHNPKQFLKLPDGTSLFAKALNLINSEEFLPPIIVSNKTHKIFCLSELQNYSSLILEPESKNTAFSITLATIQAKKIYGEDIILLVMPSDHLITDKSLFLQSIQNAKNLAIKNIVIFGINPDKPKTGYGYIETEGASNIKKFTEKPNKKTAEEFIKQGNFLWNTGIFMFSNSILLKEMANFLPHTLMLAEQCLKGKMQKIINLPKKLFSKAEDISFDYAILEKSPNISFTKMLSPWSDIGDLDSFINTLNIKNNNINIASSNISILSQKLVATIGVDNLIIAETRDSILIVNKNNLQDVKKVPQQLIEQSIEEAIFNIKVHRPWGHYEVLSDLQNHKVKRIFVKPNAGLSLQSHNKRMEHWVVVQGVASVECNLKQFTLTKGESIHIPLQAKHRLANNTKEPLIVIETQIGEYLGEDDIIRYEDNYNRIEN
jgi:mannose-1-phosphate guanylyltransferase